jgi:hypothetical protein
MTSIKVFSILCLLFYSCSNNSVNRTKGAAVVSKRDIHEVDKLEYYSKIAEERKIDPELLGVWNRFIMIVESNNLSEFIKISLDTISASSVKYKTEDFILRCFPNVFDTTLIKRFSEVSYSYYTEYRISSSHLPQYLIKKMTSGVDTLRFNQFQVLKELTPDAGWTMTFDFIKTKSGYKFFGCDSFGGPNCCANNSLRQAF